MNFWFMRTLAIFTTVLFVSGCARSVWLIKPEENNSGQRFAMQNEQGQITLEVEFNTRADQTTFVAELDNTSITSYFPASGNPRTATLDVSLGPHELLLKADTSPSSPNDTLRSKYNFSVCHDSAPLFCDQFSRDGALRSSYRWFDEGTPDTYQISDGQLHIFATKRQDLWGGVPFKRGAPLMLTPAPIGRDYVVESLVDFRPEPGMSPLVNTQVGLFVFEDVENWLFFGFTFHRTQGGNFPDGNGLIITSTIGNSSKIEHYEDFDDTPPIHTLKIENWGHLWLFYVKEGSSWKQIGPTVEASLGCHEVGMGVKSFDSGGSVVNGHFDNFCVR